MGFANICQAQTENDLLIEQILESVSESGNEDFDYTELAERLNYYIKSPLNINKATSAQLNELAFLPPGLISNLLLHISENGALIDMSELQTIDGYTTEIINRLVPFISLEEPNSLNGVSIGSLATIGRHDLMLRFGQLIEKQQGFLIPGDSPKSHYMGTPDRFLVRYRYNYGQNISASVTMDKDAGETYSSGFDFYSGNLFFKNIGKISKLAIGDYALQFGQGLTLWSGLSFGKGAAISTVPKQNIGLRPYSSTNEALFFRGAAATINYKNFRFTPFFSFRKLDASANKTPTPGYETEITSMNKSGLHRTATEIGNKNFLPQNIFGLTVQYSTKRLNAGAIGYQTNFGYPFETEALPYAQFQFTGKSLTNTGIYYDYNFRNLYFFGEASHSLKGGIAYLNGAIASLSPKVSMILLQRDYQRNYHSFFNQAIAESSGAVNEKGLYAGLIISPTPQIEISSYSDFFRFPWLKFGVDAPSKGYELFSQLTYSYKKKFKAVFRYKLKKKEENDELYNTINFLETAEKTNYRAEISYILTDKFQLRSRAEIAEYQKYQTTERGFLAYQDFIYNPPVSKFSGNMRIAIFNTPSYNSRIYAYENDVLYSYSIPGFQNSGFRYYVNGRYTLKRGLDLWLRYAITRYNNLDEIGSGLDVIKGNKKSDVKIQLRYQF